MSDIRTILLSSDGFPVISRKTVRSFLVIMFAQLTPHSASRLTKDSFMSVGTDRLTTVRFGSFMNTTMVFILLLNITGERIKDYVFQ